MKIFYSLKTLSRVIFYVGLIFTSKSSYTQDIEHSSILLSNHTNLSLNTVVRITGNQDMVEIGNTHIFPWEGSNYHDLNDRIVTTILDILFNIGVAHKNSPNLVSMDRSSFSGGNSYNIEIDILNEGNLLFTILCSFTDVPFSFLNPCNYNIRRPNGSLDVISAYSLLNEQGNNPHPANFDIEVNNTSYKLIYGSLDGYIDPTHNILFSLSEKEPTTFNVEPDPQDLSDPNILNVLTYNIGLLMPLNSNDQEERERIPVMHLAIPKNMDVIMWQEMFEQYWVDRLIDSLANDYPYHTQPHNQADIPGLTKNGGALIMSKYPILEERDFSYKRDAFIEGSNESVFADKGVKYAKIEKHGQIIHIFNTHTSGQPEENDAMGRFIKEVLPTTNYDDIVIMGGDMNTGIFNSNHYRMIDSLEALQPTYISLQSVQPEMTGTTWGYNHYGKGRGDVSSFIDYILVNRNFKVPTQNYNETQAYRLNITDKDFWGVFDLGDHQPVYGRFEFPTITASITDTAVCQGDNFEITVSTSLEDYSIQWFKDEVLLSDEHSLILTRNNIDENDWGNYKCYLIYDYSPNESVNSTTTHHPTYYSPGIKQGKLLRQFNVGPIPEVCNLPTVLYENMERLISFYPNPVQDKLFIENRNKNSTAVFEVNIYDSFSKLIFSERIKENEEIDVKDWSSGTYLINIQIGTAKFFTKFIKL